MQFGSARLRIWRKSVSRTWINTLTSIRKFSCSRQNDMKVLIGGGSGFVGKRLQKTLESKGHEVQIISRTRGVGKITWNDITSSGLPECQAVVNLAGENILNPLKRWSIQLKEELRRSRIDTTRLLAEKISASPHPPEVFVGSSAVGFYPPDDVIEYTEDYPASDSDVLTELCRDWEASLQLPEGCNTRQVVVRIGVVLGKEGGIIQQSIWPFWFGLGGVIGSGRQPFPWIHIQDICDIIVFAIENSKVTGALNGVAPTLSSNRDFTTEMASALCRPAILPLPAFVVNAVFGSVRGSIILNGQKVIPQRTLELGYSFKFPDLKSAIKDVIQ